MGTRLWGSPHSLVKKIDAVVNRNSPDNPQCGYPLMLISDRLLFDDGTFPDATSSMRLTTSATSKT